MSATIAPIGSTAGSLPRREPGASGSGLSDARGETGRRRAARAESAIGIASRFPAGIPAGDTPAARAGSPALAVEIVASRERFAALRREWDELVEAADDQPFYRHGFVAAWIASFAAAAPLRLLVARGAGGRLEALLPLLGRRGSIARLPVREWSSPSDVRSFRFDLLARDPLAAAAAFAARLRAEGDWTVVRIADVPAGGSAHALAVAARAVGQPVGVYAAQKSPYLALPGTVAELRAGWGSKWRSNLARRRRLLERHGTVTLRRLDAADPGLAHELDRAFALEASGWKGRRGEPVAADARRRDFFLALASPRGIAAFALDLLEVDGRLVAFHYALERGGVYSLLLTGHDERYRDGAPGHLLTEHVAERLVERGFRELDFLGCDLEWKRAWTGSTRAHSWLYLFRPGPLGRALARLKFGWAPALRAAFARSSTTDAAGGETP